MGCGVSLSRVMDTRTGARPVQGELDYSQAEQRIKSLEDQISSPVDLL